MTPAQATALRDLRYIGRSFPFGMTVAVFISVFAVVFCRALFAPSSLELPLPAVWALAVTPCLPFLCALVSARMFSSERSSGMLETFMASPITEAELVAGKFGSAFVLCAGAVILTLVVPLFVLPRCVPGSTAAIALAQYLCPLLAMILQCAFWCALGVLISLLCANIVSAVAVSLLICGVLPWGFYFTALACLPEVRSQMAYLPTLQHALDASSGMFAFGAVVGYPACAVFFLFAASRLLAMERFR